MKQTGFGRTWWGAQWLQALAHIDYQNRLPRGRSYAARGAVRNLVISGGTIAAQVQGSAPRPYAVQIAVPALAAGDAARLIDQLAGDAQLIARLLNRQLDPAVLDAAKSLGLSIFPERWSDLQMRCSCPDWAVPCKHLAAVVYLLSREIDGDPFLVFSLRGLDLAAQLRQRDIHIAPDADARLPTLAELLAPTSASTSAAAGPAAHPPGRAPRAAAGKTTRRGAGAKAASAASRPKGRAGAPEIAAGQADCAAATPGASAAAAAPDARADDGRGNQHALERLDFSTIPDLLQPLWRVLPAAPAFFPAGDFAQTGQRVLARVAKCARQALAAQAAGADADGFDAQDRPLLLLDAQGVVGLTGMVSRCAADFAQLAQQLAQLPAHRLADVQPQLAALHALRLLALHLLAAGAVVPQIYAAGAAGDARVALRWLPATLDAQVRALMDALARALPARLLLLQAAGASGAAAARRKAGTEPAADPVPAAAQASALCALFLGHYIRQWSASEREKPPGDKLLALFFSNAGVRLDGPGEGALAASIQTWLARLHLAPHEYQPLLCLSDDAHAGDDASASGADFVLTLAVERAGANSLDAPVPLATVLADKRWAKARFALLQRVSVLAEFFAPLATLLRAGADQGLRISPAELPGFLFDTLPALRLLGIRVLLPRALERLLRPRLSMRVAAAAAPRGRSFLSIDGMLRFDWKVAVGEHLLTRAQFDKLVQNAGAILRFRGAYVYLSAQEIGRLRAQLDKPPRPDGAELLRVALAGDYEGAAVQLDARAQALIAELLAAGELPAPAGLCAQLRPYQARGYAWLYRNARLGLGSVIADDMGLGKTLQVIAALLQLKHDGTLGPTAPALIVVPTSLLGNWQRELQRFAPDLRVGVFHGSQRALAPGAGTRPDVLLTSYGLVRSQAASFKALDWLLLIADEAQNIKNPAAAQTRALKALRARCCIAISGTPVENRLSEYWSIMDFANRGYLGSLKRFDGDYAQPIQTRRDTQALERFRRVSAPFLLRRLKSDKSIISDLPDKIEQDQYCSLTPEQTALYESVVQQGLASISGVGEEQGFKRQGLVLQLILALKQVCNHPAQYLKQGPQQAALSGKAERLMELLDAVHAAGEKALVFTQFRQMGELLADWLAQRHGHRPPFLHGGVARAQRDALVERFQGDRTERVFLLSLKAGGTGLNLTAATHVIHFDLWWNPAVEAQATDRAYRIGQQRNVQVHRFITRATFEERINDMMRSKRQLAELTVGSGEQWIGKLPRAELEKLFALQTD